MERKPLNCLVRSLVAVWVIGAGISAHAAVTFAAWAINSLTLPEPIAIYVGVWCMIFVLPALLIAFSGIVGTPVSWPYLFIDLIISFWDGPLGFVLNLVRTFYKYIVPPLPFDCPEWLEWLPDFLKWLIFRAPAESYPPPDKQLATARVKDEIWIFINGVATTKRIADANVGLLFRLFQRPIRLVHNPTDSLLIDLLECLVGKLDFFGTCWLPPPRNKLVSELKRSLAEAERKGYKRVVLIAHSQGTIITSRALQIVAQDKEACPRMKSLLEVYLFAGCAQQMSNQNVKYLENIHNRGDTVAWLGVLFPFPKFWEDVYGNPVDIQGAKVEERKRWGHLLNTHYLFPFREGAFATSRLHAYKNGNQSVAALGPIAAS